MAVFAHRGCLERAQFQVGKRLRRADEREACLLVGGVVAPRVGVVEFALDHAHGAGEVPPLFTKAGKRQSRAACGVEDMLIGAARNRCGAAIREL